MMNGAALRAERRWLVVMQFAAAVGAKRSSFSLAGIQTFRGGTSLTADT